MKERGNYKMYKGGSESKKGKMEVKTQRKGRWIKHDKGKRKKGKKIKAETLKSEAKDKTINNGKRTIYKRKRRETNTISTRWNNV